MAMNSEEDSIPQDITIQIFSWLPLLGSKGVKMEDRSAESENLIVWIFLILVYFLQMSPNDKEIACQSVDLDVLSSLPENVIHDILKFLPLRDVVRTNILSTKWRYKWCRIPQLELYLEHSLVEELRSPSIQFNNILYHLLTFHAGPISKFIFSLYTNGRGRPELDKLVYFLSRNGIQHLDFTFCGCSQYKMHSSFFTCSQLWYLSLSGCEIQIVPPAFKGFHKLISLKLSEVTISSIVLESLISNCPLIEQLVCDDVAIDDAEISAPMLRSFEYIEDEGIICFKSAPHLAKLSLTHKKYHVGTGSFLESFSALEHLKLNRFSLKFVVAVANKVPARLPFNLKCVKHLCLDSILLKQLNNVLCVLCLLRSFLHLQYFEIQVIDEDDEIPERECLKLEACSDVTFNHLREVKLSCTIGSEPELQLIKLLLAKSPMLERMLIQPSKTGRHASRTITIPIVLNSFRRASPEVQVVYNL
ncbi:hypothetical protein MTR67_022458 [Solanum verrucosum]|uniref:F-box domain-containing protein n=3 Tax=Solanum TaxID=4107 RepID=A0AAF0QVD3_SOLVR|nr:hypothetical protein MTR67_022458 [Solanum verrucosum]